MSGLAGQVAVVTGGARGVGRTLVEALAAEGAAVAALSRSAAPVEGALSLSADVTERAEVEAALGRVERELGAVTLLVNNAGSAHAIGPSWAVDPGEWWTDVESSLRGAFLCSRAVLPGMLERGGGRIVNVSSAVATRPSPYLSGYAAAKAALLSFTESLAAETADGGVRVFAVTPGRVRTEMTERMLQSPYLPQLRQGRWLEPELAARLVVFLASGRGDALSGRFLHALDDVEELVARVAEIEEDALHVPRVRTLPSQRGRASGGPSPR